MKLRQLVVIAVASLSAFVAMAQQAPKPEDQIKYRQSAMTIFGRSSGALGGMANGNVPFNKDVATQHATVIASLASWVGPAFGPGTDKGLPTKADAKIWAETDGKFKAGYDKFVAEAAKLPAAAASADTLKAQLAEVGKSCKGCHDDYRLREARN